MAWGAGGGWSDASFMKPRTVCRPSCCHGVPRSATECHGVPRSATPGEESRGMSTPRPLPLGTLLRRSRVAAGLTQEELAERTGGSPRTICDLERGATRRWRHATLSLLAEALQ